jgi:hypothetical protein
MKRWLPLGLSLLMLAIGLPVALGNMGPIPGLDGPIPLPDQEVKLIVKIDEKAKMPRLQIPYDLIFSVQLAPNSADAPPSKLPKRGAGAGRSALTTFTAGLAWALAFAAGGLWLVRRRWGRPLAVLLIMALSTGGTALLWSNAPPPAPPPAKPAEADLPALKLPAGIELTDKLMVRVVPRGDHLTLIVPKSMVMEKEQGIASCEKRGR